MPKCDVKTRYIPATFAWIVLLLTTCLFFFYPCQYYVKSHPWVLAYQGVITFFVLANFTLATFMDPGIIPKASPDEDCEEELRAPLYKNAEINGITVKMKWCVTCKFYRPPRCSHCSVCNHCIETFDHHCPWVNNCIGRRNYRFFFFFLVSLSIHMLSIFSLCLVYVLKIMPNIRDTAPIVAMILMGLVTILAIPIFGLTGFHMVLVSRGRTTNEQVTGKFKGGYNPFSRGCWHNCCYTQFGPQYPSLLNPKKYASRRSQVQNQAISTICNDRSGQSTGAGGGAGGNGTAAAVGGGPVGGGGGGGGMRGTAVQYSPRSFYDATREKRGIQVKTYMAEGNGYNQRSGSTTLYSKLSPGRECSDTDLEPPPASQSQDCEPTPPLQRHNSSSFYLPQVSDAGGLNGSVSTGGGGGGGDSPRHMRLYHPRHSPHARPRSNPGTPTQPRRPDFIGLNAQAVAQQQQQQQAAAAAAYYEYTTGLPPQHPQAPSIHQQQQQLLLQQQRVLMQHQQQQQALQQQQQQAAAHAAHPQHAALAQAAYGGSPQRRFLSEGELVRQGAGGGVAAGELSYARSNNTVDNIRELAGSPQRGVYMWKDTSPGFNNSVGQQQQQQLGQQVVSSGIGSSAGTLSSSGAAAAGVMPHAQYMQAGGGAHPLIMTHSRLQDYAIQQQQQQQQQQAAAAAAVASYHRSNPTSPTTMPQVSGAGQSYIVRYGGGGAAGAGGSSGSLASVTASNPATGGGGGYQPALRGGVAVFPPNPLGNPQTQPSPQIKRKQTPTRPMSFVRALEMTDSMEMQSLDQQQNGGIPGSGSVGNNQQAGGGGGGGGGSGGHLIQGNASNTGTPDRASIYDMNYEISV
ncbi:palmitoyltransferase ZDHHC8 isoform X5 [Drosophila biarmipes]|uniref:palmitoyltransferase ZDHHC8 isoform X5 n=1 Tax=Drosophila biarmipes TaxID=125945 RepID=UPI0007E82905|nr:palmitoyltransferase ZDHHC8 isoform X5 [Drosophila biarmipes]